MKRFLIGVLVLAFVVAIPLSTTLMAKKVDKVKLCHITGVNDAGTRLVGHVIEVAQSAVKAHCAHGDHNPKRTELPIGADCWRPANSTPFTCEIK
ncbi:hypothetical protein ACFLT9_00285 [Acidobacteriota bacterium]